MWNKLIHHSVTTNITVHFKLKLLSSLLRPLSPFVSPQTMTSPSSDLLFKDWLSSVSRIGRKLTFSSRFLCTTSHNISVGTGTRPNISWKRCIAFCSYEQSHWRQRYMFGFVVASLAWLARGRACNLLPRVWLNLSMCHHCPLERQKPAAVWTLIHSQTWFTLWIDCNHCISVQCLQNSTQLYIRDKWEKRTKERYNQGTMA